MANTTAGLDTLTYQELKEIFEATFGKTANGISKDNIIKALQEAEEKTNDEEDTGDEGIQDEESKEVLEEEEGGEDDDEDDDDDDDDEEEDTGELEALENVKVLGVYYKKGDRFYADDEDGSLEEELVKNKLAKKI